MLKTTITFTAIGVAVKVAKENKTKIVSVSSLIIKRQLNMSKNHFTN